MSRYNVDFVNFPFPLTDLLARTRSLNLFIWKLTSILLIILKHWLLRTILLYTTTMAEAKAMKTIDKR